MMRMHQVVCRCWSERAVWSVAGSASELDNYIRLCCRGIGIQCRAGSLVLFDNVGPDTRVDMRSAHQSCPVTYGHKVVISTFFREDNTYINKNFVKRKWNGNVFCEACLLS
jgi:hypothetical protein